jgi:hypothetical protein
MYLKEIQSMNSKYQIYLTLLFLWLNFEYLYADYILPVVYIMSLIKCVTTEVV